MKTKTSGFNSLQEAEDELKKKVKAWYKSKTVWFNLAAFGIMFLQGVQDFVVANGPEAITFYTLVNIVLRAVTHEEITWKNPEKTL